MSQFEVTLPGGLIVFVRSGKIRQKSCLFRIFRDGNITEWFYAYLIFLKESVSPGVTYHLLRNREGRWMETSFPAFANPPDDLLRRTLQKAIDAYEHSR